MKSKLVLAGLAAAVLSACGGGSGDSAATAPAPITTKVSGTAAVGAALANVTVQAKCAVGGGSATTAADGTFTINIADAKRPCVLSAVAPDGTVLHSVVEAGTDTSVVANITPLTELVTAALAQGSTSTFFDQFDANAQARLTAANLSTSTDTVRLALTGLVDISGTDPLKGALVAASGGKAGNALDQLLDQLAARLATSKATVADLSTAIGSNAGPVAIGTILQKASATCAGLRTGKYFGLRAGYFSSLTVDADALTLTDNSPLTSMISASVVNPTWPLAPAVNDACRFDVTGTPSSLLVSKSGVSLLIPSAGAVAAPNGLLGFVVPAQQLPLADLAGNWNALAFQSADNGNTYGTSRLTFTLDANGKMTAASSCDDDNACTSWGAGELATLTANNDGSFAATSNAGTGRAAAFKGTDGLVSAVIGQSNGLIVATKQVVRALPVAGSTNSYWDYVAFADLASQFGVWSTTITSVDPKTSTYTRTRIDDKRVDAWTQNVPVNGLRYRAKGSAADELIAMSLGNTGVGVNIGLHVTKPYLDISVNRP
ncbi:hypothetical protein [Cupriavidus basilensis]|uniref:hypothetical protein n=1 Tax=Cupriavidus basilensis TaxID=68895 RepID=UPI0007513D26|nr:hypothetical protein [Cupriavidus basilensis]